MATLARGHALRSQFRPHVYNPTARHSPYPSVCNNYLQLSSSFSTSANHSDKHNTNTNTVVPTPKNHEINAPISTFPATLVTQPKLPSTAATTDKIKRIVHIARAYLAFYKSGLKNVYRNYRASIPLRKSLGLPAYIPTSPPRSAKDKINVSPDAGALGRGQFQLIRRSARDVRRMIPFTLILIVCGEFTPLIIPIFGSAITPATCRIPSQIAKEREAASKRKYLALSAHASTNVPPSLSPVQVGSEEELDLLARFADMEWVAGADSHAILRASAVFGLVKKHDPAVGGVLVGPIYRPRLKRYIHYLSIDDAMIRKVGVKAMSSEEVRFALDERGLGDVASLAPRGKAEVVEREALERWLVARKGL